MERLNDFADINKINCNKLYVNYEKSKIVNSNIVFNGKNNVLYVEDGVVIKNSTITFNKDNSLIYLSTSKTPYIVDCFVNFNNTIYVGRDCYFNDAAKMHFLVYENANIIIGNDGLFSFDIWLRTSDPHLIYDIKRKKRINYSKSIFVGDHVWLGQRCLILKGSQIGSGSVVGGGAVVSNKLIASNTVYAGNPAKCVSSEIFFSKDIVHSWTEIETKKFDRMDTEQWIYKKTKDTKSMLSIDLLLRQQSNSADRLDVVKECLVADTNKNRFFIGQNSKITKYFKLWDKNSL